MTNEAMHDAVCLTAELFINRVRLPMIALNVASQIERPDDPAAFANAFQAQVSHAKSLGRPEPSPLNLEGWRRVVTYLLKDRKAG
jgi:hypothetical protein